MARGSRRTSSRDHIINGLMGAGIGALNFQLSEMSRRNAEAAEIKKEERLAAIAEKAAVANHERELDRMSVNADIQRDYQDRGFAQQDKVLRSSQDHDVALVGLRNEQENQRLSKTLGHQASEGEANRATQLEIAKTRSAPAPGELPHILGSDGQWYAQGTPLPAGVSPAGGSGVSWAPSASKSGPAGVSPAPGVRTPVQSRQPQAAPFDPKGWSGTYQDD